MKALVWFRSDLRVRDNPALYHAVRLAGEGVLAVFAATPVQWRRHDWSDLRVAYLMKTLRALRDELNSLNISLQFIEHPSFHGVAGRLAELADSENCTAIFFNREYEVNECKRDELVERRFHRDGREVHSFVDQIVFPERGLRTPERPWYSVYTPFRKAWERWYREHGPFTPLRRPKSLPDCNRDSKQILQPIPDSIDGFAVLPGDVLRAWPIGERASRRRLLQFCRDGIGEYHGTRDDPADERGTSRLSPSLAVGSLSIREAAHEAIRVNDGRVGNGRQGPQTFLAELIWREFYRQLLIGYPRLSMGRAFQRGTERIKWRADAEGLKAWQEGHTGYPIVDAGMRQLNETGWMHNRLRMITASFLVKDLLIDWREGERYFMRRLIDGDLANNNGGWQWSASTGADSVPYFRIFNPWSQGKRFDPDARFIRKWVPELRDVPAKVIHRDEPDAIEVRCETGYPTPIVEHAAARERALEAFGRLKA